jgi:hypothetical protein
MHVNGSKAFGFNGTGASDSKSIGVADSSRDSLVYFKPECYHAEASNSRIKKYANKCFRATA